MEYSQLPFYTIVKVGERRALSLSQKWIYLRHNEPLRICATAVSGGIAGGNAGGNERPRDFITTNKQNNTCFYFALKRNPIPSLLFY